MNDAGSTIISTVMEIVLDAIDFGMDARQAVNGPRFIITGARRGNLRAKGVAGLDGRASTDDGLHHQVWWCAGRRSLDHDG